MKKLYSFINKYFLEIFVVIFGLILRIPSVILEPPFWDETFSWVIAQHSYTDIIGATARDTHPPLYYELLKFWNSVFGDGIASMRLISILFWIVCLIAIFIVAKRLNFSRNKKILVYGFLSIMPITIWMSSYVRMYMMALAFVLWGIIALDSFLHSKNIKYLIYFSILMLLGLYTLNVSLFAWMGLCIFYIFYFLYKDKSKNIKEKLFNLFSNNLVIKFLISQIIVFVLYFPWFLVTLKQSTGTITRQIAWIDPFSFKSILQIPIFLLGVIDNSISGSYLLIGFFLIVFAIDIIYRFFSNSEKRTKNNPIFYMLLSIVVVSISIIILLSIKQSVIIPRTFFLATVPAIICIVAMVNLSKSRKVFVLLCILFLSYGIFTYTDSIGRLKYSFGERNMIEFLKPVNEDNNTKLIVTSQQAQYSIAYQQIKYLTRSNPKIIKLDKETDTGDYIIYDKKDFISLDDINQNFYYINYTGENYCKYISRFNITLNIFTEEVGRSAQICKYEKI